MPLTKHQDLKILSWLKSDNSIVAVPQSGYPYMWISSDFCFVLSSGVAFSTYSSRPCAKFCRDQTGSPKNHGDLPEHDWACISFKCESVRSNAVKNLPNLIWIYQFQKQWCGISYQISYKSVNANLDVKFISRLTLKLFSVMGPHSWYIGIFPLGLEVMQNRCHHNNQSQLPGTRSQRPASLPGMI